MRVAGDDADVRDAAAFQGLAQDANLAVVDLDADEVSRTAETCGDLHGLISAAATHFENRFAGHGIEQIDDHRRSLALNAPTTVRIVPERTGIDDERFRYVGRSYDVDAACDEFLEDRWDVAPQTVDADRVLRCEIDARHRGFGDVGIARDVLTRDPRRHRIFGPEVIVLVLKRIDREFGRAVGDHASQHGVDEPCGALVAVLPREVDRLGNGGVIVDARHEAELVHPDAQNFGDGDRDGPFALVEIRSEVVIDKTSPFDRAVCDFGCEPTIATIEFGASSADVEGGLRAALLLTENVADDLECNFARRKLGIDGNRARLVPRRGRVTAHDA